MSNALGAALRRARRAVRMTLSDVSRASGLSESFISQFERGQSQASLGSLTALSRAVGVELEVLLEGADCRLTVVRSDERATAPAGPGAMWSRSTRGGTPRFEVAHLVLQPAGMVSEHRVNHDSDVHLVVEEGRVVVTTPTDRADLGAGDSATFTAGSPYEISNTGPGIATVLVITSPPYPIDADR